MSPGIASLVELCGAVLMIVGLKGLAHPRTAARGNLLAGAGMALAVGMTLGRTPVGPVWPLAGGLAVGTAGGLLLALLTRTTAMPELVALLNAFGGAASAIVARIAGAGPAEGGGGTAAAATGASVLVAGIVGTVTFTGSVVAFAKLRGLVPERRIRLPAQHAASAALFLAAVALGVLAVRAGAPASLYAAMAAVAAVLGVVLVLPIGGADMPVVVSLLNAYSGIAAAGTGFVLGNDLLIVAGALVGASGLILTRIMCKAMNRSIVAVAFGGAGAAADGAGAAAAEADPYGGRVKRTSAEEVALLLEAARRVAIVPGFGLAVAQAQHAAADLARALEARGVEVEFSIHPVAGRMPGHMNVLLAEAKVPYEKMAAIEDANPRFAETDVALVVGANDIVNLAARTDPKSPLFGMPILDVDRARTVVVVKRSLRAGFAAVANPLFVAPNALLLLGDAREALEAVARALEGHGG